MTAGEQLSSYLKQTHEAQLQENEKKKLKVKELKIQKMATMCQHFNTNLYGSAGPLQTVQVQDLMNKDNHIKYAKQKSEKF